MNAFLKKFGVIGGTAAACVACCAGPVAFGPLFAWLGVAGLGMVFSSWYLLLLAAPALVFVLLRMRKKTKSAEKAYAADCGCSTPSLRIDDLPALKDGSSFCKRRTSATKNV